MVDFYVDSRKSQEYGWLFEPNAEAEGVTLIGTGGGPTSLTHGPSLKRSLPGLQTKPNPPCVFFYTRGSDREKALVKVVIDRSLPRRETHARAIQIGRIPRGITKPGRREQEEGHG